MKKLLLFLFPLLSLLFIACEKENEDYGVHSMITTVMVKQTGSATIHTYGRENINTTANVQKTGALQIAVNAQGLFKEQLTLIVDKPKEGLIGTYTLCSKDNPTADASVRYFILKELSSNSAIANLFISRDHIIEGSLIIAGYDKASRQQTVNGSYQVVIKDVRNPTKILGQTSDADNSDVTITGTFAGARLYHQL